MYWVNVAPPRAPRVEGAPPAPPSGPAGTLAEPVRRSNYSLTLEVLPK